MSDLNISDVVPKLRVKLQHSTILNTNNFALIWILVPFKGNINMVSLFCGVGPQRAREKLLNLEFGKASTPYFWELPMKTFLHQGLKQAQHTLSIVELMSGKSICSFGVMFYKIIIS